MRHLLGLLQWGAFGLGAALLAGGRLRPTLGIPGGGLLLLGLLLLYWSGRPNRARVAPSLAVDDWTAVDDGSHNGFTDLLTWRGSFWLAYITSPSHLASDRSRLVLLRSADARQWQEAARFDGGGEDIRDPKLAVVHDRLIVYALLNNKLDPEPYATVCAQSEDGRAWTAVDKIPAEGWLLGRPKTGDDVTWYAPAHRLDHARAALLRSTDGVRWTFHSLIHEGDGADETAVEFLPDGRLLAAVRLEMGGGVFGHPQGSTLIAVAAPPYDRWTELARSAVTRLDSPSLLAYGDKVYGVGRYQPASRGPFWWPGSALSRKRTSLFLVSTAAGGGLVHLSDLPSAGDTAYAGLAHVGDRLYVSYYSSDPRRDPPWLIGMLRPTSVRVAAIDVARLEALAEKTLEDSE